MREAIVLPMIFLTVALAGGVRVSTDTGTISFLPPPLATLVLAVLLLAVMTRAGLLIPARLMNGAREPSANASGAIVLVTLFAASAQLLNCLTPETGLLNLLGNLFFAVLFCNTLAAEPDRRRLMRSLTVVLGSALVIKYVILAALYDPSRGWGRRVLTLLLEGVTLGGVEHVPFAAATGYLAFAAIVLYGIGLALLPREPARIGLAGSQALESLPRDLSAKRLPE